MEPLVTVLSTLIVVASAQDVICSTLYQFSPQHAKYSTTVLTDSNPPKTQLSHVVITTLPMVMFVVVLGSGRFGQKVITQHYKL